MDNINSRVNSNNDSQAQTVNNAQAVTAINSQASTSTKPPAAAQAKPGRPRLYVDKSEAMKAYRTRVAKLQQANIDRLDSLTPAVLSGLLTRSLRTLASNVETPESKDADEARKVAGRIIKLLRATYKIRLG